MAGNRRRCRILPALLLLWTVGASASQSNAIWVQAVREHADTGLTVLVVRDDDGRLYLRQLDLALLDLHADSERMFRFQGELYVAAESLTSHRALLDREAGRLHLVRADAVMPTTTPEDQVATSKPPARPAPRRHRRTLPPPEDHAPVSAPTPALVPETAPQWPDPEPGRHPPSAPQPATSRESPALEADLLLDVVVNRQAVPGIWLARTEAGEIWLDAGLLPAVGMIMPPGFEGAAEVPLSALAGQRYVLDSANLNLEMTVPPELFAGRSFGLEQPFVAGAPPADLSAIVGYDLSSTHGGGRTRSAGLLDIAIARGRATCASVHAWRQGDGMRRLDSACRLDWPERMLTLEIGDSHARGMRLQPGVRFTGLRIGTDFELNPYFRTLPDFDLQGSARLPSTLEVWIDQQLALRTEVPPGPFDVHDIPVHTGSGELRAVVTDVLGRQSVISAPVFVDPRLLRPGLLDWSAEVGRLRLGFPGFGAQTGERFAAVSARRGMSASMTADLRAEVHEDGGTLGLGGVWQVGRRGLLEFGLAGSRSDHGSGHAVQLGYSMRGERMSFGLRQTRHSREFTSLGWLLPGEAPARLSQANLGMAVGSAQFNFGYIDRRLWNGDAQRFAHAAMTMRPWGAASLTVSLAHRLGVSNGTQVGVHLTVPLGSGLSAQGSVRETGSGLAAGLAVQRQAPPGNGIGWRAGARYGPTGHGFDLDGLFRGSMAELRLAGHQDSAGTFVQGSLSGSIIAGQGGVYLARREPGSYALVQVDVPGVRVYRDNQVVAVTNAAGRAIIPGLRPFQRNPVHLEVDDLPLAMRIDQDRLELVPGRRQALSARFRVQRVRYLSTRLLLSDGTPVPPGVFVQVEQGTEPGFTGYAGEVFLEIPDRAQVRLHVRWNGSACSALANLQGVAEEIVEIDALACVRTEGE